MVKEGQASVAGSRVEAVHGVPALHRVAAGDAAGYPGEIVVSHGRVGDEGRFSQSQRRVHVAGGRHDAVP